MNESTENKIKVFISYSWDSKDHQKWVLDLADLINERGGYAIVDRTHLKFGGHIKTFMQGSIEKADVVLMILTPNYKRKADDLNGGAGYEYNIINSKLFEIIKKNDKYIPVVRLGTFEDSVTDFLKELLCLDLRDGVDYENNLEKLLLQILNAPIIDPEVNKKTKSNMDTEYQSVEALVKEMKGRLPEYFKQIFDFADTAQVFNEILCNWKSDIGQYHNEFKNKFSPEKMELYSGYLEDFKNKTFAKELWTVRAALKTTDPDLALYKKNYREASPRDIYDTVVRILNHTHEYVTTIASNLIYKDINEVEELQLEYLDEEDMFLNKIIGFGIRSELLHRYYPSHFPIMTQKSL